MEQNGGGAVEEMEQGEGEVERMCIVCVACTLLLSLTVWCDSLSV